MNKCKKSQRQTAAWGTGLLLLGGVALAQAPAVRAAASAASGSVAPASTLKKHAYVLQPGDVVTVTFRYTPEFNEDATVAPDGNVTLRAAGSVKAVGLTLADVETSIAAAAKDKLVNPEIAVTLKDFDRPHVYVAGEVLNPGRQDLRRPTTALQAVLMCGGPKEDAALGRVLLFRRIDAENAEVHVLKLSRYGGKAHGENDMLLEANDMILVRHDVPSRVERYMKVANIGLYLNPLQNVGLF